MKKKETKKLIIRNSTAEFLIFTSQGDADLIEVRYENETIWLTQKLMAQLFAVKAHTITYHLKEIFNSGELNEQSVARKIRVTASDGKSYNTLFYNLDAIISVGYRVNSTRATQFRQWATQILREFAIKGYVLDKKRLENGSFLNEDYFEHLLSEIREIRLSERRFYQKITDIYSTSIDYNQKSPVTQKFFAKVQNKLHYAIHGRTAAELIKRRANSKTKNMGLSSWENSPKGKILKTDVVIAKNYLTQEELESMGRIVSAYLDLAEERAKRKIPMTMEDWSKRLDQFLKFDERQILRNAGKISKEVAKKFAEDEFEKYRITQDRLFESDFDREIKNLEKQYFTKSKSKVKKKITTDSNKSKNTKIDSSRTRKKARYKKKKKQKTFEL
ncbi:MAG: virulence RhuM family protein [Bdellovibrionales bacterium]|nr:virulence RhuM family protein [Bdellovibrionales bacterium]